jgi:hydrogenase nickel incorporation protein HypB
VINKIDIAEAVGFDRERALASVRQVAPGARLFELSARTGAGMAPWLAYLREHVADKRDRVARSG